MAQISNCSPFNTKLFVSVHLAQKSQFQKFVEKHAGTYKATDKKETEGLLTTIDFIMIVIVKSKGCANAVVPCK